MSAKVCPVCGEPTLLEKRGEYRMELPPTLPGGFVVIPDTSWLHCDSCGEDILSAELERAIQKRGRECQASSPARIL
jgi:hypothetical protein